MLVTGPTGSGKSTTLASLIDIVNRERSVHIMTVEDPIEFLHTHKRSLINQREVGEDTHSFADALKHVLRQDPDVILVGEMRDLETISTALTAAETGHLVFATLHTQDAPQSIDRVIDVFPAHQQQQVRVQLAVGAAGDLHAAARPDRRRPGPRGRVRGAWSRRRRSATSSVRARPTRSTRCSRRAGGTAWSRWTCRSRSSCARGRISLDMALERCANEEDLRRLAERLIDRCPRRSSTRSGQERQARRGLARGRERAARRQQAALDGLRARSRSSSRAAQASSSELKIPGFSDRVKLKDVAVFSRQFATMINSGLSLLRSLYILAEQTESKPLAEIVNQVRIDVEKGSSLSQAMAKHPKAFNRLYVVDGARRRGRRCARQRAACGSPTRSRSRSSCAAR